MNKVLPYNSHSGALHEHDTLSGPGQFGSSSSLKSVLFSILKRGREREGRREGQEGVRGCSGAFLLLYLPAKSRHGLYTVEEGGVLTGVFIALVIPGRDAIHRFVLLKQGSRLTKVAEEVR